MSANNAQKKMKIANDFFVADTISLGGARVSIFHSDTKFFPVD